MDISSHSVNFEDIILSKALHDVDHGFYVDIGSKDPDNANATKFFYNLGWNGINIEPNPILFERYTLARKRDINLNLSVANFEGTVECVFSDVSCDHQSQFAKEVTSDQLVVQTKTRPLNQVLEKYQSNFQDIHFLKITVEDYEMKVLEGLNLHHFRPWIILVKSLFPARHQENREQCESHLVRNEYEFVFQMEYIGSISPTNTNTEPNFSIILPIR